MFLTGSSSDNIFLAGRFSDTIFLPGRSSNSIFLTESSPNSIFLANREQQLPEYDLFRQLKTVLTGHLKTMYSIFKGKWGGGSFTPPLDNICI
jgi:hypothetical protein